DNGSHFISELTQAVVQQCNTTHVLTTPYHPMSNGQTERFNATLAPSLAKLRFDTNRPDPQYEIGDLVLIKVLDKSSKLKEQFEGPYR
ncbi:unnamed protein product, partial [Didymodactylos carnosus]